jgi:hypothetical protein
VVVILDNGGDVFVEIIFPLFTYHTLSVLNGKYGLYVDLGIGIGHLGFYMLYLTAQGVMVGIFVSTNR